MKKNILYIISASLLLCFIFYAFVNSIGTNFNFYQDATPVSYRGFSFNYIDEDRDKAMLKSFSLPVLPVSVSRPNDVYLVPMGLSVGVRLETAGILVLGTSEFTGVDRAEHRPSQGLIERGDMIVSANGRELLRKEDLSEIVSTSTGNIEFTVKRDGTKKNITVTPELAEDGLTRRVGLWVRDGASGIGTITYYNPESGKFGALGHGIIDNDTRELIPMARGDIFRTNITNIRRGVRGQPGELVGDIQRNNVLGEIKLNNDFGIYGYLSDKNLVTAEPMRIATSSQVQEGPAQLLSSLDGSTVVAYDIYIESVNRMSRDDKRSMIVRITDPNLLSRTGGIIQGMSGSPIVQDGKLVGALTHVFVQEPSKGYAIFIEIMLSQERVY